MLFFVCVFLAGCLSREDLQKAIDQANETQAQAQDLLDTGRLWIEAGQEARNTASQWIDEAKRIKQEATEKAKRAQQRAEELGIDISDDVLQQIDSLNRHADELLAAGEVGVQRADELLARGHQAVDTGQMILDEITPRIAEMQHALDNHQPWYLVIGGAIVSLASLLFGAGGLLSGIRGAKTIAAITGGIEAVKPLLSGEQRKALGNALSATTDDADKRRIAAAKSGTSGQAAKSVAAKVLNDTE
jgi:hypothetical protein